LAQQDDDVLRTDHPAGTRLKFTGKISTPPQQSEKDAAGEKNNLADGKSLSTPPAPHKPSADLKTGNENFRAPAHETVSPEGDRPPAPAALIAPGQKRVIYFATDSTGFTNDALATLKAIVDYLSEHPAGQITIEGYGDSNKNYRHNQRLSQLRANVVKSYMVRKGIAKARIKAYWMGSENPASSDDSLEDRAATHQVQVKFDPN
jgi:outer membrane protein OmpA-like peptidoglycan-associated protein